MGKIGHGYGSEWHLLRYLGRHRNRLDQIIKRTIGKGEHIEWMDFGFASKKKLFDKEWTGIAFLKKYGLLTDELQSAWQNFWPQRGNAQNWDAIGRFHYKDGHKNCCDFILVEAKSHITEVKSACRAKLWGRRKIEKAMTETKRALGVDENIDYLKRYYQYANRIAALHFLTKHGIGARLVFIYFLGDQIKGKICPRHPRKWQEVLEQQHKELGLPKQHLLGNRMHEIFVHVNVKGKL